MAALAMPVSDSQAAGSVAYVDPDPVSATEPVADPNQVPDDAVPVPELATETSNTVLNPDGSHTALVASGPVNYEAAPGEWEPISNELVDSPDPGYAVENEANSYTVSIPDNPSATPVRFETDAGWVTMKLTGSDDVEPDIDGTEATYTDLIPAADEVTLAATDTGVKETITLDAPPTAAFSYRYALTVSSGITPVLTTNNQIEFRDAAGAVQFGMPVPNMQDSASPEPAYTNAVTYGLVSTTSGWRLTVTPDLGWLADPARIYPVIIDPTVDKSDTLDCWVQSDMTNANRCRGDYIYAGLAHGSQRHGLLKFGVGGLPSGARIDAAQLYLFLDSNATDGSAPASYFTLCHPNAPWNSAVTWASTGEGPWWGGSSGATLTNTSLYLGGSTPSGWQAWDVRQTVARWLDETNPLDNRGFLIRENNGVNKMLGFLSGTNALSQWRPILRVDYTDFATPPPPVQLDWKGSPLRSSYRDSSPYAGGAPARTVGGFPEDQSDALSSERGDLSKVEVPNVAPQADTNWTPSLTLASPSSFNTSEVADGRAKTSCSVSFNEISDNPGTGLQDGADGTVAFSRIVTDPVSRRYISANQAESVVSGAAPYDVLKESPQSKADYTFGFRWPSSAPNNVVATANLRPTWQGQFALAVALLPGKGASQASARFYMGGGWYDKTIGRYENTKAYANISRTRQSVGLHKYPFSNLVGSQQSVAATLVPGHQYIFYSYASTRTSVVGKPFLKAGAASDFGSMYLDTPASQYDFSGSEPVSGFSSIGTNTSSNEFQISFTSPTHRVSCPQ